MMFIILKIEFALIFSNTRVTDFSAFLEFIINKSLNTNNFIANWQFE